ncbi:hypothetical protein F511_41093 [Dorcoceras hygrometricum]|uniref:Uncharacterized protein n=1 Tax=Dorcoceras hygrometricum TaxID=472368 RepID=A0A2Z7AW89_9LAMI|nr:hypothetical protein F511_41093 [Dorcoceras hygrometricum]
MHSKRCRLNKLIRHRLIYPVVGKSSRKHLKPTTGQPAASISFLPAGQPDASNSTSSRRATVDPVASLHIQSTWYPDAIKAEVAKRCNQAQSIQSTKNSAEAQSSSRHESAAKQLTIYEELSKLDVNC